MASNLSMQPKDAAEINDMFFGASASERALILHNLADTPLRASARIPAARAARAIETLEMAAFAADIENFTLELGETLILPSRVAAQVVNDPGGEPLACAARALDMPSAVFQRVLLFLNPEFGTSVNSVYRLSRLYDRLSERSALIMLAAWRGSTMAATRAKYRPSLYDDERHRARAAPAQTRPAAQPGAASSHRATGSQGSRNQARARSRKCRPARSSVSTIQTSGSNRISFASRSSTDGFRHRLRRCRRENALDRPAVVIDRLRRRRIQHGIAVEQRHLDEDRAGLLRAAPAHRAEYPLGLAAAQISRHPYAGFQSHGPDDRPAPEMRLEHHRQPSRLPDSIFKQPSIVICRHCRDASARAEPYSITLRSEYGLRI